MELESGKLIALKDVRVGYGVIEVLHGISLHASKGEIIAIVGANGAGKTTTLDAICGKFRLNSGNIVYNKKIISSLKTQEIIRMGIAHVPEGRRVFPGLTVRENLIAGRYHRRRSRRQTAELLEDVLERFPKLRTRYKQRAWSLSGGEQQMLAVARALMGEPELLLLDEPSLGLAPILKKEIFAMIDELHKDGLTIILVEQDAAAALSIADRGYVLELGQIILEGRGADLLNDAKVRAAYLGG